MAAQVADFDSLLTADRTTGLHPTLTDHRRPRRGPAASLPGCAGALPCTALQRLQGTINSFRADAHQIRQELPCQPGAAAEAGKVFMPRCCSSTHRLYLQGDPAGALVESRLGVRTAGKRQKPLHVRTLTSETSVSSKATRGRSATLALAISISESPSERCLGCCAVKGLLRIPGSMWKTKLGMTLSVLLSQLDNISGCTQHVAPMLELRLLRGLDTLTVLKKIFSCSSVTAVSLPAVGMHEAAS